MTNSLFKLKLPWEVTTLGEACDRGGGDIQTGPFGSQLHASDYVPTGIPSIMPQNIGDNRIDEDGIARITEVDAQRLVRYRVKVGDIVYSRRGDVERRALIREREDGWLCGTGCLRVRFGEGVVHPPYAAFYLGHTAVREWIVRHAHGATMPNLNTSILSALPFVVPPLNLQRAIAHILGILDDKIEFNRQINETLEAMAQALFRDWFVDFGPVQAKMAGLEPFGLSAEAAALFPDSLDAEGKPEGWFFKPLSMVIELNPSERLGKDEIAPYLDMAALPTQGSWPDRPILRAFGSGMKFRNGDTLLARITPCLENGKTAFIQCLEPKQIAWGSTEFIVMRPKEKVPAEYNYLLARDGAFRDYAIQSMTGTSGRQRVQAEALARYQVVVPSDGIWHAFGDIVRPWFNAIKANSEQSKTLAKLRDLLLPKLLSGELRVQDTDNLVREG